MPTTDIIIYQEKAGDAPLIKWLDEQPEKIHEAMIARIELLAEKGNELRRPICDILRDGVYELRKEYLNVNYRILYMFCGKNIVLLSHGCTKKDIVPPKEIDKAIENYRKFKRNPNAHTFEGEIE